MWPSLAVTWIRADRYRFVTRVTAQSTTQPASAERHPT